MPAVGAIDEALGRGASPDAVLDAYLRSNPSKANFIKTAQSRGAKAPQILDEIVKRSGVTTRQPIGTPPPKELTSREKLTEASGVEFKKPEGPGLISRSIEGAQEGAARAEELQTGREEIREARAESFDDSVVGKIGSFLGKLEKIIPDPQTFIQKLGLPGVGAAEGAIEPLAEEVVAGVSAVTPEPIKEKAIQGLSGLADWFGGLDPEIQQSVKDTAALGEIVGLVTGTTGLVQVGKAPAKAIVKDISKQLAEGQATKNLNRIDAAIKTGIAKGVRPGIRGKTTPAQLEKFEDKARVAIESIIERKAGLALSDEFGEVTAGQLPQSLRQFGDAIEQTKKSLFTEFDTLLKDAKGVGATVDLAPIASELDAVISNATLQTLRPDVIDYAKRQQDRFAKRGQFDPEQTQEAIKLLNQSLENFYRNPTPDSASRAYVDALVANQLRGKLDEVVEGATGKEFQALKSQYGALKEIEKDVMKRAVIDARKNNAGLLDFADIFSGGEAVAGIVALDPALLAKAATQKGIKEYFKWLNNPNRIVKSMFKKVDKGISKLPVTE